MKQINTYITEKFKLRDDTKIKTSNYRNNDYTGMEHAVVFVYAQSSQCVSIRIIKITSLNSNDETLKLVGVDAIVDGTWNLQLKYDDNQLVTSNNKYYLYYILVPLKYFLKYADNLDKFYELNECTPKQIDKMFGVNSCDYLEKELGNSFNTKYKIYDDEEIIEGMKYCIKHYDK